MKKSVKKLIMVAAVGLFLAGASSSFAESGYCTGVKVINAGAKIVGTTAVNQIRLQNTRNDCGDWAQNQTNNYTLMSENADAMLASALTALSLGYPVTVVSATADVYPNGGTMVSLFVNMP